MAVRVQFVAEVSRVTGFAPATWERITGYLANAGYILKGQPGGGIGSAHYQAGSIVSALMGGSAHVPSEAPAAVRALENLRARGPNRLASLNMDGEPNVFVQPGTSLRDCLEQDVLKWASPTPAMLKMFLEEEPWLPAWTLEMSPSMPFASLSQFRFGIGWGYTTFHPDRAHLAEHPPGARRKLELTLPVLKVAGELLADTLARQSRSPNPNSAPGSAGEGDARPETTKASGTGIHEGLQSNQPTHTREQAALLNKVQSMAQEPKGQRQFSRSARLACEGTFTHSHRSGQNGAHWPHTTAA